MKKFEEYYIGLDMGTGSVGWAVTDPTYNIIKRHGKALWGIRLFESAKTAEERRIFRTSRRRTERRKNRLHLLQEIFAEEISKKDMGFYQRMKESKYWHEDKKDINGNMPELPYALFADDGFTDKDYYKKYPTIFHLRYALATNTTDKPDIRLLYLALHHIIKHRGHFLFEGKKLSEVKEFSTAIEALVQQAEEQEIDLKSLTQEEVLTQLEHIMSDAQCTKSDKKTQVSKLIVGTDKQKQKQEKAIAALITGCTVKLSDIFADPELDKEEISKICFSDNGYEEKEVEIESVLADRFLLIAAAKGVYDWTVLHDILGDARFLSEAKVKTYEKHRDDLRKVKQLLRMDKEVYEAVFGVSEKNEANYSAYIGMAKKNGKKQPIEKKCSQEDFYKFLKKQFDPCCSDDSVALMSCSDRPPTEIPTDAHSVQSPPERQIAQHWYNYYQSHPKGHQNNHWQIPYVRIPPSRQRMPADYSNPGLFSVKSWRKPTLPLSHPYGQTSVPFWSLPRLLRSQNEHPR